MIVQDELMKLGRRCYKYFIPQQYAKSLLWFPLELTSEWSFIRANIFNNIGTHNSIFNPLGILGIGDSPAFIVFQAKSSVTDGRGNHKSQWNLMWIVLWRRNIEGI
jgi:hypothetical protein